MPFELWVRAENFYSTFLGVLLIIFFCLLLLIFCICFFKWKKKRPGKVVIVFATWGILLSGGIVVYKTIQYFPYLAKSEFLSPLVRDREKVFGSYEFYSDDELTNYSRVWDPKSLRSLTLYSEEVVTEPVAYLGSDGEASYFETDGKIFLSMGKLKFNRYVRNAQLVGSRFRLQDKKYQEIGFFESPNKMFQYIMVNELDRNKTFRPDSSYTVMDMHQVFHDWNF